MAALPVLAGCGDDSSPTDSGTGDAGPSCADGVMNGSETDVDCGGAACGGCADGLRCNAADDCLSDGCDGGMCRPVTCGDSIVNGSEECDEGGVNTATCTAACTNSECGDAFTNPVAGEECDAGGDSLVCDADCTAAACGDGYANTAAGETCDGDGAGAGGETATCNADCTTHVCGDMVVNMTAGEDCDDGNMNDVDECTNECLVGFICGDGVIDTIAGETCDGDGMGAGGETAVCDTDCSAQTCSDGIVNMTAGEACDGDGAGAGGETVDCNADCTNAACGDGQINATAGETCDGDAMGTGGETATCNVDCTTHMCGDTVVNMTAGEDCDDGNVVDDDFCSNGCAAATCADGVVNGDETDVDCLGHCGAGSCAAGLTCTANADCRSMRCEMGVCAASAGCAELYAAGVRADGVYVVDSDGAGAGPAIAVYCNLSGAAAWTLVARYANQDAANWMLDTGEWWYDRTTPAGDAADPSVNADMISSAFWTVAGTEMKITRSDDAMHTGLIETTGTCFGGTPQSFRSFIASFGNFRSGAVWGNNSVAGTCTGTLGGAYATTNGFQQALCTGDIGAPSSVSFWSDWSAGDGAVMMIGGGGNSCARADHGIGVTEANAASFVFTASSEDDFGANGSDASSNDPYALNLWVR